MKHKMVSRSQLARLARRLKSQRKKIVFTNGTFDLLHAGHVMYLEKAKALGDILMVGINTDKSVKSYKSPHRPIVPQSDRIRVLTALECVDYAILFEDPTPIKLILAIQPDVLVKGADWKKETIVGAKEVESWGGKVVRVRLLAGHSTTSLIAQIKSIPA